MRLWLRHLHKQVRRQIWHQIQHNGLERLMLLTQRQVMLVALVMIRAHQAQLALV